MYTDDFVRLKYSVIIMMMELNYVVHDHLEVPVKAVLSNLQSYGPATISVV